MRTLGSRRPSVLFQQTTKPVSRRTPVWDDPDEDCPSGADAIVLKGWQNGTYPAGLGEQARHVGVARRRAGLCVLVWQAVAARMGVAVRGPGPRRTNPARNSSTERDTR